MLYICYNANKEINNELYHVVLIDEQYSKNVLQIKRRLFHEDIRTASFKSGH